MIGASLSRWGIDDFWYLWWSLVSVMIFGICDDGGYDGGLTIPFVDDVDDSGLVFSALLVEAAPGEEHLPPHHHAWHCHHPHPQYHHHHRRWERCPVVTMFSAATSSVRDFPPTQSLYHHHFHYHQLSSSKIWLYEVNLCLPPSFPCREESLITHYCGMSWPWKIFWCEKFGGIWMINFEVDLAEKL